MRVIAGRYRGYPLDAPAGMGTRPITDRVKESLFSVLGAYFGGPGSLPDGAVLDLFAGAGSLGIESLSRGATYCLFVERDRRALRALRGNVARLKAPEDTRIAVENAWTFRIPQPPNASAYKLIFVDPPYRDVERATRVLDLLDRLSLRLAEDGLLILRRELGTPLELGNSRTLTLVDERIWGRMHVALLARQETQPTSGR